MKYMKMLTMEGLVPKAVDMDYDFLCDLKTKYEAKGKTQKAEYLSRIIAKLDAAVASGETMSADLIEKAVNDTMNENDAKRRELKAQIKALDNETSFLRGFSRRCIDEDSSDVIVSIL